MTSEETDNVEVENNAEEIPEEELEPKKKQKKESPEEAELKINMNPWGFFFMFITIGIFAYLLIGYYLALPPFAIVDIVTEEIGVKSAEFLAVLIVLLFASLGLGFYFGWMRKPKVKTEEIKESEESTDLLEPVMRKQERQQVIFSSKVDDSTKISDVKVEDEAEE
ncbi:MAG: hypothetical protein FK734_00935 [Asgard group archaeon]|nr:hypothetical protein [Asgard group archaeon]